MLAPMENCEHLLKALVWTHCNPRGLLSDGVRSMYVDAPLTKGGILDNYTVEVVEHNDPWQVQVCLIPQPVIERRAQVAELADRLDDVFGLGDDFGPGFAQKLARAMYEAAEKEGSDA